MITAPTFAVASTEIATSGHIGMKMPTGRPGLTPRLGGGGGGLQPGCWGFWFGGLEPPPGPPPQTIGSLLLVLLSGWGSGQFCTIFTPPPIHQVAHGLPFD